MKIQLLYVELLLSNIQINYFLNSTFPVYLYLRNNFVLYDIISTVITMYQICSVEITLNFNSEGNNRQIGMLSMLQANFIRFRFRIIFFLPNAFNTVAEV